MKHSLEVDNVLLEWGFRRILYGVFLKCETGRVTGLLGRNGSGKSCLLRIIFGDMKCRGACVRIDGRSVGDRKRDCRDIRYLPQGHFVPKYLTLQQVFGDFGVDFEDFLHYFPEFGRYRKARIGKLSGGERRLVEIFVILVSDAKFVLLDEPFAQVMPVHIEVLKTLIRREAQRKGIVVTDHFFRDVMEVADELYVVSAGKTQLICEPEDLKRLGYLHEEENKERYGAALIGG